MKSNTFTNQKKALERVLLNMPKKIAKLSLNAFKDNFKNQGFFGKKWKTVARKDPKSIWYQGKRKANKPILSMTGALKKSVTIDSVGQGKMLIVSDLEYSAKHNEGGSETRTTVNKTYLVSKRLKNGKASNTQKTKKTVSTEYVGKLAKRQFIGEHPKLNQTCMLEISDNLKKVL